MTVLTGDRGTLNVAQNTRKYDVSSKILLLEPSAQPLCKFSNMANKRKCVNPKYHWWEDALRARFDAVDDASPPAAAATAVDVDDGTKFAADDLVKVTRTGEIFSVTSVATNALTIVRSVGGTAAADFLDDDELMVIGTRRAENATSNDPRSENPTEVFNYTQIIRNEWGLSRTMRQSDQFTQPHDWDHQMNKTGIEHVKDKELAFVHGEKSETDSSPSGFGSRTTGGVYEFITTNITDAGGTLTEAEFWNFCEPLFRYSTGDKTGFASRRVVGVLNAFPRGRIHFNQEASKYGVRVLTYTSPFGNLNLVVHNLLEGAYAGDMFALDMSCVAYRYLAGGVGGSADTHVNTNIQENDRDGRKDEFLAEVGLEFGEEKKHGLLTGVTG